MTVSLKLYKFGAWSIQGSDVQCLLVKESQLGFGQPREVWKTTCGLAGCSSPGSGGRRGAVLRCLLFGGAFMLM